MPTAQQVEQWAASDKGKAELQSAAAEIAKMQSDTAARHRLEAEWFAEFKNKPMTI